jgi:hypothetical protein
VSVSIVHSKLPKSPRNGGGIAEANSWVAPPDFTPRTIRAALELAETGDLSMAGQVCDAILSDGRLRGLMETRSKTLLGCDVEFEPAGDGRRSAGPIKDLEDGEFWEMAPESEMSRVFIWGWLLNKGPGELLWERDVETKKWKQYLRPLHPGNLHRDTTGTQWLLRTAHEGDIEFTPGDGHFVLYEPFGRSNSPHIGLWFATALLWLSATFAEFDWSRRNEARGRAAIVGTTGVGLDPDQFGVDKADIEEFGKLIAKLRNSPGIALPPGYDLKAIDFGVADHETFQSKGDRAYSSASILWLGQTLSTEVKGGSLAATKEHNKVRQDYLESDEATVSTFLRPQVLRPWAAVRYSDPNLAPWARFDTAPAEDLAQASTTTKNAAEALSTLLKEGVQVDIKAYCERYEIAITSSELKKPEPPPVPTAAPGQPPAPAPPGGT